MVTVDMLPTTCPLTSAVPELFATVDSSTMVTDEPPPPPPPPLPLPLPVPLPPVPPVLPMARLLHLRKISFSSDGAQERRIPISPAKVHEIASPFVAETPLRVVIAEAVVEHERLGDVAGVAGG